MSSMRPLTRVVAIAILCTSLTACSESDADDVMARLQELLAQLEQQSLDEYMSDPFNSDYEWTEDFFGSWPDGIPVPGGQAGDGLSTSASDDNDWDMNGWWSGQDPGTAEEYGEQLEDAGWEAESQTTETDEATGWETTTSTYQNDEGEQVVVTSVDTGGTETISVTVY